ncbi:MAG: hypothetical protein JXB00_19725 [Bacteroidales bacterium]|nr:hypothetical protein [Bacteroidales bacterium]
MKDIFIIENSFLIRSALQKLISEHFVSFQIHEMISLKAFFANKGKRNNCIIVINECLLTEKDEIELAKFKEINVVKISCEKAAQMNDLKTIFIDEEPVTIIKKLNNLLDNFQKVRKSGNEVRILSRREEDILKYVALGLTNREIADKLFLSAHTVITHRKNISSKLGIKTIAGFTVYALLNKIILPSDIGLN